jgi:hypothetical protein
LITYSSCGLDCIDKKTGLHKSSQTIQESRTKNVFKFEMLCDTKTLVLDNESTLIINNAWVENDWKYECINNSAVIEKDSSLQFVLDAKYSGPIDLTFLLTNEKEKGIGCYLGSILDFNYVGGDSVVLNLMRGNESLHRLKFYKKKV